MSFTKLTSILTATTLIIAAKHARAETAEALVNHALSRNPELKFYVAEIAAAKGTVRTAVARRNPELNTQVGYKHSRDNSSGATGDGATWAISLSQTFEYPGRIALRKAIANHDVNLAELHLQQFRLKLASRVRTLAYRIAGARAKSAVARELGARFQTVSDVLKQRPTAGTTQQLETQIITANGATFRRQEREAALLQTTMRAELNQLCGRPANAPIEITSGDIRFSATSIDVLLNAARANAFDIKIRETELAQQGFKVALSKNERYPAIAVGPFYSLENAIDQEQQVGLGISLPLPMWDRNLGNIATNQARQHQAEASVTLTRREVEKEVTQNAATLAAKRSEIDNLTRNDLTTLREAAELADRDYQRGAVPLPIYIETQKQYFELVGVLNDLQREALEAAQELEVLTGLKLCGGDGDD